jgi:PAS domain S-box-containing protein
MFAGMRDFLDAHEGRHITMYAENLDLSLFPGKDEEEALAEFYRYKYEHESIDVLVPVQEPSLRFLLKNRGVLFPKVPIVYMAPVPITPDPGRNDFLTGITLLPDIKGTIELMRKIHPDLKKIALVAGTGTIDRNIAGMARRTLRNGFPTLEAIDLTGLSMEETLTRASRLPASTALLFLPFFKDGTGRRFIPVEALESISRSANAPVYCVYDSHLGYGCVGGRMTSYEELGKQTAAMVLKILEGKKPGDIPPETLGSVNAMFDWRAMKRWRIPANALPPGSVIKFRELTLWERDKWVIIGSAFFTVAEAILIAFLLAGIRMRKRAERELKESELRYRTVADFTYDWEYWIGPGNEFLYNSPSCERVTGYTPDEFREDPGLRRRIIIPEDQGVWANHLHEEAEMGELRTTRFRIRRKDREIRWIEHSCVPVKDASGTFLGYRASNRDVTERQLAEQDLAASRRALEDEIARRKIAQEALATSEADLKRAHEVAVIGSWKLEIASNRLYWSDGVYDIFGLPRGTDLSYEIFLESVHPDDREMVNATWSAALRGELYDIEHRIVVDGRVKWVREKAEVDFSPDGVPFRGTGIVQDITRRKLAENEQHKLLQSLTHVSRVSTVGELTTTLAHEINQPLAAILANAQAARHMIDADEPDLAELRETLDDIINDDKRAREVVQRIRGLMKKDGSLLEKLDLQDVVRESAKFVEKEALIRNVSLRIETDGTVPKVVADRVQIQQVLINLLMNAMESMTESSPSRSITVRSFTNETGQVVVSVEDSGKGIVQDDPLQMFEPFYTTKNDGLGLGLAISRSIIEAHGGKLLAFPNPLGGSVFFFSLPHAKGGA